MAVTWFPDNGGMMNGMAGGGPGGSGEPAKAFSGDNMMQYVQTYGGKAGLGALALVSLVMMLMMVRRVGEGPVLPGEAPPEMPAGRSRRRKQSGEDLEDLEVSQGPVGVGEVTEHLLMGREVDETTLRSQKLVEQVAELVKDDPDMAVGVLQRWIESDKQ